MSFDPNFVRELFDAPWFENCGSSFTTSAPILVKQVGSKTELEAACNSNEWENLTLEAQNSLTMKLHQGHIERYQDWNQIVLKAKAEIIEPLTITQWLPKLASFPNPRRIADDVRWNVLGACMEHTYLDCVQQTGFFHHLLFIYKAGHIPCGWTLDDQGNSVFLCW